MQIFNTHNKSDQKTLVSKQNLNHNVLNIKSVKLDIAMLSLTSDSTKLWKCLVEGLTNRNGCYKDIKTNDLIIICSKQDMKAYFSVHWLKGKSELIYNVWCLK